MTSSKPAVSTVVIIILLFANLGFSTYIAFKPSPLLSGVVPKSADAVSIAEKDAMQLAESLIPLYNRKDASALYDRFDPLAKVQFSKDQLSEQIVKLGSLLGEIEDCAYSHATVAGTEAGRTFYTLLFKVRLSGGPLQTGDLKLTVAQNKDRLTLYGFFVNGSSRQGSQ